MGKCLVCLLLGGLTYGQAVPTSVPSASSATAEKTQGLEAASATTVGPDDAVVTINGFCTDPAVQAKACKTVITRAQFEKLTEALQPGMPLSLRLKVANALARNTRMSAAAEKRGLDKTPAFEEEMRFARMQLLSQDLDRVLQAKANNVSDEDLADFYETNKSSFEQATMARIFVPHARTAPPDMPEQVDQKIEGEAQRKASVDAMTEVASDLRSRAVKGEDPDKLQIEAYAEAGIKRTSADTKLVKVRRSTLPPQHESVMDLKPGEVSEVFSDPDGARFIYKMISKESLTLEDVRAEIRTTISSQRYRDSMKSFQGDVIFSDAYFNPPGKSPLPSERTRRERKDNPSTPHD